MNISQEQQKPLQHDILPCDNMGDFRVYHPTSHSLKPHHGLATLLDRFIIRNIIAWYHMISYYIINIESLNICYHMWYQHILEASTLLDRIIMWYCLWFQVWYLQDIRIVWYLWQNQRISRLMSSDMEEFGNYDITIVGCSMKSVPCWVMYDITW